MAKKMFKEALIIHEFLIKKVTLYIFTYFLILGIRPKKKLILGKGDRI